MRSASLKSIRAALQWHCCAARGAGPARGGCLDKKRPACAWSAASTGISLDSDRIFRHAPLPLPYLRRAPRQRHRQGRPAVRLVPSHPRPWRPAVHRSARPLRPDPGGGRPRQPGVQGRRDAARRMGGADRRQGAPPARTAPKTPNCRPGRSRSTSPRSRCWARPASCRCRCSAIRNILKKQGLSTASSTFVATSSTTTS